MDPPAAAPAAPDTAMAENDPVEKPLSTSEWFITIFVLGLPLIGLVMHFVWAFGPGNVSRRNLCRAVLLWLAILFGLAFTALILFLLLGGTMAALLSQNASRF